MPKQVFVCLCVAQSSKSWRSCFHVCEHHISHVIWHYFLYLSPDSLGKWNQCLSHIHHAIVCLTQSSRGSLLSEGICEQCRMAAFSQRDISIGFPPLGRFVVKLNNFMFSSDISSPGSYWSQIYFSNFYKLRKLMYLLSGFSFDEVPCQDETQPCLPDATPPYLDMISGRGHSKGTLPGFINLGEVRK